MQSRYDLLLTGGHVIDPSRWTDKIADIGVDLGQKNAAECRDVEGKYVSPGLIDLHGHWFQGSSSGVDPHIPEGRPWFFRNGGTRAKDQRSSLRPSSSPSMSR